MLFPILAAIILFGLHNLCDFVLQTEWQGKEKTHNFLALVAHTATYASVMTVFGYFSTDSVPEAIGFGLINFLCHTIIDFYTSKPIWKYLKKGEMRTAFIFVAADQFLEITLLLLAYYYVTT